MRSLSMAGGATSESSTVSESRYSAARPPRDLAARAVSASGRSKRMVVEPFVVAASDAVLADLRERLTRTRRPEVFAGRGWGQGTDNDYLGDLVARWREEFD